MIPGTSERVLPGFGDPALDAQAAFRVLLNGMSHPGRIFRMPPVIPSAPPGLDPAAAAACLTLLDSDTTLWTDLDTGSPVLPWLRFHCGCPVIDDTARSDFALATAAGRLPPLEAFQPGTDEAPESAATVILQVEALDATGGFRLSGPGIPELRSLAVAGLPTGFWNQRHRRCRAFPMGLDVLFVCGERVAALPRTTQVET